MRHTKLIELLNTDSSIMDYLQDLDRLENNDNRRSEAVTIDIHYFTCVVNCYKKDYIRYLKDRGYTKENANNIDSVIFKDKHNKNTKVYIKSLHVDYIIRDATPREIVNMIDKFDDYLFCDFYEDLV